MLSSVIQKKYKMFCFNSLNKFRSCWSETQSCFCNSRKNSRFLSSSLYFVYTLYIKTQKGLVR